MGEIRQANFRIDQDTAAAFRQFCDENGWNQAEGFDNVMRQVELNKAKAAIPGRAVEIERFEKYTKDILSAYLTSLEINSGAEERIREQFANALDSKDKTIASLQEKADKLAEGKQILEQVTTEARSERDQAVKEAAAAKEQAETAAKLAEEKDKTILNLTDKLGIAESKADGYDDLKKSEETAKLRINELEKEMERIKEDADRELKAVQKDHEIEIRELKTEMERKVSDVQKDAALAQVQAVADKEREMNGLLREADMENAKLQAKLEALQSKINEMNK